jgi:intracellular sulfur oxidation DsrE/DsrF family protein
MKGFNLAEEDMLPQVSVVPSAASELIKKQNGRFWLYPSVTKT